MNDNSYHCSSQTAALNLKGKIVKGDLSAVRSKIRSFNLVLDNDNTAQPGLYLAGSTLSGRIVLDVVKPTSIVRIRFTCEGYLRILDKKKVLISSNEILFGSHEEGRRACVKYSTGVYTLPFSVNLPADLPTTIFNSFEFKVFYKCTAVLVRKVASDDIVLERTFMVHNVTQALYDQLAMGQEPSQNTLALSGLNAVISLPKSGLYLGDKLIVAGTVQNPSSSSRKVKVGLSIVRNLIGHGSKEIVFIKLDKTKKKVDVVSDRWSKFFKVSKNSTEEFEVETYLNLPEPTTMHELISIEYTAKVTFVCRGLINDSAPKSVTFPITIAPPRTLAQYPTNYSVEAPMYNLPSLTGGSLNIHPDLYPDLPEAAGSSTTTVPSAPELDESDDDNVNVVLPSYEDVISGKA